MDQLYRQAKASLKQGGASSNPGLTMSGFHSVTPRSTVLQSPMHAAPVVCYSASEQGPDLQTVLNKAWKRALGGGIPGMAAMGVQVGTLMWLRTTMNYQYRYGTSTSEALRTLYKQGGIPRFYKGVGPALIQGPLSRFGDTAANTGMLALLESYSATASLPIGIKTLGASVAAGCFRILLMPVDALKTTMQVEGKNWRATMATKMRMGGPFALYHGALAAATATFVGHYPWFFVYNSLDDYITKYEDLPKKLLRSAFIGFSASVVSDCCSNSIRVVKTTKQTAADNPSYTQVVRTVVAKEGVVGLMTRGLKTKIIVNGLQGIIFSVAWRLGQDHYAKTYGTA